jgi:hypothetical protein
VTFGEILPLAFVMIAGPQIITAFFLVTTPRWATNSIAFLIGAGIAAATLVTIAYFVGKGIKTSGSGHKGPADRILDGVVLVLVVYLMVHVYRSRGKSSPPKWMDKLMTAEPKFALGLGLALVGLFPTNIASAFSAGFRVARNDERYWQCLPLAGLVVFFLALPAIGVVLLGKRAETVLPKVRHWVNTDSWMISEIVLALFAAFSINGLIKG